MKNKKINYYLKRFINSSKEDSLDLDWDDKHINDELYSQWQRPNVSEEYYDSQKGWLVIAGKINNNNNNVKEKPIRKTLINYVAVACMVALLFGAVYMLSLMLATETVREIYVFSTGKQDEKEVILSDGTKVKLGALSQLTYPSTFDGESRIVQLNGQAFFDVTHDEKQAFEVQVEDVTVEVLGTSFEIFENKDKGILETTLVEGSVKVKYKHPANQSVDEYILKPDERLNLILHNGEAKQENINADNHCAWRDYNGLQFVNETFENIIPRLERWYNTTIVLEDRDYSNLKFSFKLKNEPIETILDLMAKTSHITYVVEEDVDYHKTYRVTTK